MDRVIKFDHNFGSTTSKIFTNSSKKYFILDNSKIHHFYKLKELFTYNIHEIIYLLLYSPQLNPVELLFSKWKAGIKRHILTDKDNLIHRCYENIQLITIVDYQHWIKHSLKYLTVYLSKDDLTNELPDVQE